MLGQDVRQQCHQLIVVGQLAQVKDVEIVLINLS